MRQSTQIHCAILLALCLLAAPAVRAVTAADQSFAIAKQLVTTGNTTQAITELKKFLAAYPADTRVRDAAFMLGRCYRQQQQLDQALAAFAQVIDKTTAPEFAGLRADAYFQMGDCYFQQGTFTQAARSYAACAKLAEGNADLSARSRYWLAQSLFKQGKSADALPEYRKVVDGAPTHQLAPWSLYSIGMISLDQSDYATAITALERLTTQYKDAIGGNEATYALALAYAGRARDGKDAVVQAADFSRATQLLSVVIDAEKTVPATRIDALISLAETYSDQHNDLQAAVTYTRALEGCDPTTAQAAQMRLQRGHAYYNAGRFTEAAADYTAVAGVKAAAELAPQAMYWLGNSWYQQGTINKEARGFTEAINAFRRFLTLAGAAHGQAPRATLLIALCYEELANRGDVTARTSAVAAFKEIQDKWPNAREASEIVPGITRQTTNMSVPELEKVALGLPNGSTAWNVNLKLAQAYYLAGRYKDAQSAAQKVLDGKATDDLPAKAAYLAAAALVRQDRDADAIPYYRQALAGARTNDLMLAAQRELTQACLDTKRFIEARDSARALVALPAPAKDLADKQRDMGERYILLGDACVGTQQYVEALDAYQHVVQNCPASPLAPDALMSCGWIAETRKDWTAAIAAYRGVVEKFPAFKLAPEAEMGIARAAEAIPDRAVAQAAYQEMLTKFPTHALAPDAAYRLGNALNDQKNYQQAIDAYSKVPATATLADQAAYAIAWAYRDMGKPEQANAQFLKLPELFPKSPLAGDSLYRVGDYWVEQQNNTEAIRAYTRALAFLGADNKLTPSATYKLGVCAFNAKDFATAATAFGKVPLNFPTSEFAGDSLFWKAQALENLGGDQFLAARESYLQYTAKLPAGTLAADAALGAGRTALAMKQYTTARGDLQKALALCAQLAESKDAPAVERAKNVQPEAQYTLAQAFFAEKAYPDAITNYAAVAANPLEPWYSRSILQMARCSALTGDLTAAERTLRLLVEKFPNSDAAQQAAQVAQEYKLKLKDE